MSPQAHMLGSELLDDGLWGKCWDLESSDIITILNLLMDNHSGIIEGWWRGGGGA